MLLNILSAVVVFVVIGVAMWALAAFAGDRRKGGCGGGCACTGPCEESTDKKE